MLFNYTTDILSEIPHNGHPPISLENGQLMWTSHGSGFWGRLGYFLDFVPGFTNGMRDTPSYIEDGKIFCDSGRILDIHTGTLLERIDANSIRSLNEKESLATQFYNTKGSCEYKTVSIGNDIQISHPPFENNYSHEDWEVIAENENGKEIWRLTIKELNRHIDGNFYSYRLALPYLYLVVSKERNVKPHPTKQHYVVPNPTFWQLITVDLQSGKVIQKTSLGTEKQEECRIEDVDEDGILIGKNNKEVLYYSRST